MWSLFKKFDVDNTDFITVANLKEAFKRMGRSITEEELDEMVRLHDLDKTGKISFNEFKQIFGHYDEGQPANVSVDFDNLEGLE